MGAVQDGALSTPYKYVTEKPAADWMNEGFDDTAWQTGLAPFGHEPSRTVRTDWTTPDIYLRKTFNYTGGDLQKGAIVIFHDDDTEVYVNGRKILGLGGFLNYYRMCDVTESLKKALKKGANTLAIHTHQKSGGQFIDMALLVE